MHRRTFIKTTGLITAGLSLDLPSYSNKLPQWKGFNLLDFYSPNPAPSPRSTTEEHFKWMRDWGFDFIRIPIAYPHYLQFDRSRNIKPEEVYQTDEKKL